MNIVRDRDVELFALERIHQHDAHFLDQRQLDAGQFVTRADHDVASEQRHHAIGEAENDGLDVLPSRSGDHARGVVDHPQDFARTLVQQGTGARWRHAARVSRQQRHTERFLELADLQAQRRLRNK